MVGKKSGTGEALRKEGLARFHNNMSLTSWPQVAAINQKNYYTEYLKRDDQILAYRLQNEEVRNRMAKNAKDRDRALAMDKSSELPVPEPDAEGEGDTVMDDVDGESTEELAGSKIIVMHVGSQNLRVGLASDALPKTIPMCIARKSEENEAEEDGAEPKPKRLKLDDGQLMEPEKMFGPEFSSQFTTMSAELKTHMRQNKRRTLPNSKEMVVNYNRRTVPETISEHNDPLRVEWTEIPSDPKLAPEYFTGEAALRIPDYSKPRYKLSWPIQHGWCNERDYNNKTLLFLDIALILEDALKSQLNLDPKKDWGQYSCVFVIPDLYERAYVTQILEMLMREFGFGRVCFVQESLAGTFGAGYTTACVVDIGAQKTSICCVDEGMCIENSRVNLKYGGADVTETFIKMMLFDHFPYEEINLKRRYDFLLAEELKRNICTINESNVSVQVFDFHLRASGQDTRKYTFKAYDEVLLAPMGLFQPTIFDTANKLKGRRKLITRSLDLYDGQPNDPTSAAQSEVLTAIAPPLPTNGTNNSQSNLADIQSTPSRSQAINAISRLQDMDATPRSSVAGSPAPDAIGTPQQGGSGTPAPATHVTAPSSGPRRPTVEERDDVLPIFPLDSAIFTSVANAARPEDRKFTDLLGGILVIGGGCLISGFHSYLEERMHLKRPEYANSVMVGTPPRELDPQVVVWKGASVFAKLDATNDSWIGQLEYDRLGSRVMTYKCMWAW
ncbi:actin-like protein arp8 [Emmonsiellopsis sp. PD_33]|nr:actin-like protein arp8 [Emmonsiellopsis sp. PD_33]KAK2800885.1 actin-like protein arp8 [Onygenales sp. PD_10]